VNYAIQILKKEKDLLQRCLEDGNWEGYTEAKKDRDKKLEDINEALSKLIQKL